MSNANEIAEMLKEINGERVTSISQAREILEGLPLHMRFRLTKERAIYKKNNREFVYRVAHGNKIILNLHNACRKILNKEIQI